METTSPGQTTILSVPGIPTGATVGFQVQKAATGSVAIARTETGVIERPAGSGNRVVNFIAPAEGDLFLVVLDWSDGVLAPETTKVIELRVTTEVQPGESGLGAVADYVKMRMGGETWNGLTTDINYGAAFVARAITLVKERIFETPPDLAGEDALPARVLDYVGLCVALELIPAARDYWGSQYVSQSTGDDPVESVTYVNRAKLMDDLRDDLMRKYAQVQAAALPLIATPILRSADDGPCIDEEDDYRSTDDPRAFPAAGDFPITGLNPADAWGIGLPQRTGVRIG